MLNCDVLFHPRLLDDLLATHHDAALLIAYREHGQPPFGDEEMKVKVRGGRVVDMSKTMDPDEADGENLGIVKFGPKSAPHAGRRSWTASSAPDGCATGRRRRSASSRRTRPLHAIGTRGLPWIEIDFPEDYQRARARRAAGDRRRRVRAADAASAPSRRCGASDAAAVQRAVRAAPARQSVGPATRIVAIGGGTGLPNVLRGLRPLVFPEGATDATRDRLVAIVDDVGRRRQLGAAARGD